MKQQKTNAKPLDDFELSAQLYLRLSAILLVGFALGLFDTLATRRKAIPTALNKSKLLRSRFSGFPLRGVA